MDYPEDKKPASPQKVAANRSNAQLSTGPRTDAGKAKAAQNSYKHGIFALRLFPNDKLRAEDAADYNMVYNGLSNHYQPVGFMELFWVEKAATEALRIARVLGYGQKVLDWECPFESRSVDKLLRYESTVSRNFAQAVKNLELLQAQRKAELSQLDEPTDPEPGSPTEEPKPTPNEPSSASGDSVTEEPTLASTLGDDQGTPPPDGDQTSETIDNKERNPAEAAPPQQPAENVKSPTPPTENHQENPPSSSRWVETAEDQKLIDELHKELYGELPS